MASGVILSDVAVERFVGCYVLGARLCGALHELVLATNNAENVGGISN